MAEIKIRFLLLAPSRDDLDKCTKEKQFSTVGRVKIANRKFRLLASSGFFSKTLKAVVQ